MSCCACLTITNILKYYTRVLIFISFLRNDMRRITKDKIDIIALTVTFLLFSFFLFFTEMEECGDSFQYMMQYPMREPVYSLILQFEQFCFGSHFDIALSVLQNLLAIVCIYWAYKRLSLIFDMNNFARLCTLGLLIFPHVLTPLASSTRLVLTTTIMTEGITYSLYYVWFVILLGILSDYYSYDKEESKICFIFSNQLSAASAVSLFLSLLLALTRGQMLLCILLWLIVVGFKAFMNKSYKKLMLVILITAIAFPVRGQLTKWYNLAETGNYVDTVSSKPMLLANVVYVSDPEDAQYIEEDDLREAFLNILTAIDNDNLSIRYAKGNIIDKALFHEDCHEPLNFEYIDPEIRKVIKRRNGTTESQFLSLMIQEDTLCAQIALQLLPNILPKYLKNYFIIASLGFVRSVAIEKSFIPILAILIYLFAIALTILGLIKKGLNKYTLSMIFVLISICGTVLGTSLMIECIHRYMIYNFPFFYIIGLVLLTHIIKTFRNAQ